MERKIGEIFSYKGQKYIVQKYTPDPLNPYCEPCIEGLTGSCTLIIGECTRHKRSDKTDIIAARLR